MRELLLLEHPKIRFEWMICQSLKRMLKLIRVTTVECTDNSAFKIIYTYWQAIDNTVTWNSRNTAWIFRSNKRFMQIIIMKSIIMIQCQVSSSLKSCRDLSVHSLELLCMHSPTSPSFLPNEDFELCLQFPGHIWDQHRLLCAYRGKNPECHTTTTRFHIFLTWRT